MTVPPSIALAVATRDRSPLLERCLLPALREAAAAGHDVVVVDQSVGTETRDLVAGLPGVRYLFSEPGLSRARNAAIAATTSELIAFTDDDVELPAGWLDALARAFEEAPGAGAVCGRAVTSAGDLQPGAPAGVYRWPAHPFRLGSGFNLAVRRRALDEAGGFDEDLGAGAPFTSAEDTDLLYRILRAGWEVVCRDDITVVHHEWRSRAAEVRLHYGYGVGAGAQTAKHLAAGDRYALRLAVREAGHHAFMVGREAARLRPGSALLQLPFLAGLLTGYVRRRRARQPSTIRP